MWSSHSGHYNPSPPSERVKKSATWSQVKKTWSSWCMVKKKPSKKSPPSLAVNYGHYPRVTQSINILKILFSELMCWFINSRSGWSWKPKLISVEKYGFGRGGGLISGQRVILNIKIWNILFSKGSVHYLSIRGFGEKVGIDAEKMTEIRRAKNGTF